MNELKIIVLVKPVPDPECPPSSLEINDGTKQIIPVGVPPVINPYDENALEAALRIKDTTGARVITLSLVERQPGGVLHKARTGADESFVLLDGAFKDLDGLSTASVLAAAIEKIGGYSLVLAGRQAADWSGGVVGPLVAGILGIPCVTVAKGVSVQGDKFIVDKMRRTGYDVLKVPMPAVVTISSEIGDLRLFPLRAINEARKKPFTTWSATDLGLHADKLAPRNIVNLSPPPSKKRDCLFIGGQTVEEKAEALAMRLREDKIL